MKTPIITITITAALAGAMMTPPAAHAGQSEWATAGKILAGVTAFQVLSNVGSHQRNEVYVEEHVYRETRHPSSYGRYYGRSSGCRNASDYGRYRPPPPPREHYVRHVEVVHVERCDSCCRPRGECGCGPIIISVSECRRLYQPRIHGHVSYLQAWDECSRSWETIGTRDSIW